MQKLSIEIVHGNVAPRYDKSTTTQLSPTKSIVTTQGMVSGKPLVDFQMVDDKGNKYFFMITGDLIKGLAQVVEGCNNPVADC